MTILRAALMIVLGTLSLWASPVRAGSDWHHAKMTWYGPGFYGHRMACGGKLTRKTIGVAHRTLPCHTLIEIKYRDPKTGRHHRYAEVLDRGPYSSRYDFDATARLAIHLTGHPPHTPGKIRWRIAPVVW